MPTARLLSNGDFYTSGGAMDEITIPASKYAVQFTGGSQYLTVPSNAAFTMGTGAFTLEAWVYRTATSPVAGTGENIFDFRSAEPQVAIELYYDVATGKTLLYVNGSVVITGATTINTNTWYHVALVRSSTTTTLYINGVSDGTYSDSNNYATTTLTIGGRFAAVSGDYRCWQGYISNVRIIKGTALYTTNFLVPAAPLNAITNTVLLTCQSSTIIDNSTNAFVITNSGPATIQSSVLPTYTANRYLTDATLQASLFDEVSITNNKYAVSFNGSSQYLISPASSTYNIGTSNFTIEAWVYFNTISASVYSAIGGVWLGGKQNWLLQCISSNIQFATSTTGSNYVILNFATTLTTGQWYHIAVTGSSLSVRVFVNGTQVGTTPTITSIYGAGNQALYIGVNVDQGPQAYLNGFISNFRFVKGTALYTSKFIVPAAPLNPITNTVLLTCQSATIVDNSTNAFTITNTGTATVTQPALTYASKRILNDGSMVVSGVYDEITQFFPTSVEYLAVAGGGSGGGYGSPWDTGGGGAGGLLNSTFAIAASVTYTITIGAGAAGGAGNNTNGSQGTNTTIVGTGVSITLYGGGGGALWSPAGSGGSGGGVSQQAGYGVPGKGVYPGSAYVDAPRQGYDGAPGGGIIGSTGGYGGGGGGSTGSPGNGDRNGGPGTTTTFSGASVTYAAGGYGGNSATGGNNTGNGGGGGTNGGGVGGAGGSGIFMLRYADNLPNITNTTGSPTLTVSGGYKIYKWTSSGSFSF